MVKIFRTLIVFFAVCAITSCNQKKVSLFEMRTDSGIEFTNQVSDNKDFNIFTYRNFYNGAGVAIGDINNDSLPDVFFTANMGPNKLFVNKGNFKFEDVSAHAGFGEKTKWSTGVVMVDVNADNWLDIYVCNAGYQKGVGQENELYINNQNGTFTERAAEYGLDDSSFTTHAAFFDYDRDGDLDCYLLNNSFIPANTFNYVNKRGLRAKDWPVADFLKGGGDKLLQNNQGKYKDVSEEAGIYGSLIGFGLGVTVGDVNGDLYPDIYVSNDFFERDYLYINQKDGTFSEELEGRMQHTSLSSMGADMADINNDDYPDIFVTDMLPPTDYRLKTTSSYETVDVQRQKLREGFYYQYMQNALQVNNKAGRFYETAYLSGVAASDWSWGGLIFDADNDGLSDIYVCNGIFRDVTDQDFIDFFANDIIQRMVLTGEKEQVHDVISKMPSVPIPNKAFKNQGDLKFTDQAAEWGLGQNSFSNGAAYGDLDNDGDLDLVVNNVNQPAFVYENKAVGFNQHKYLSVVLSGDSLNTHAIGTVIKLYIGSQVLSRELIPSRGFQSSCDYKQVFGLGDQQPDSLKIFWPNGKVSLQKSPPVNQVLSFSIPNATDIYPIVSPEMASIFQLADSSLTRHVENEFVDFYFERNVPMLLSREGPAAAMADINGDGKNDLYIGGAQGQPGSIYLGSTKGYTLSKQPGLELDKDYEDTDAVFFDADQDGDVDLLVASGGNSQPAGSSLLQNRLYVQNNGQFSRAAQPLPKTIGNTSVVLAFDFDSDRDLDVFIGGRGLPFNYGSSPPSYLWRNDGHGVFTDITDAYAPIFKTLGMVTAAQLFQLKGDAVPALVVVGEWMAPHIFRFGKTLSEVPFVANTQGLWQTVETHDLDGDGDLDLLLGNYGENFCLHANKQAPLRMFLYDFDNNENPEKIITKNENGKDVPVFLKRELQEQIPSLKKKNLKHHEFAEKSVDELFGKELIQKATSVSIHTLSSCIAWNEGAGNFTITPLPLFTQFSSTSSIAVDDVNHDGKPDLLLGGNRFGFLPQFGRLDASYGWMLLNQGNRNWKVLQQPQSGLHVTGTVKKILVDKTSPQENFIFFRNDDRPMIYRKTVK